MARGRVTERVVPAGGQPGSVTLALEDGPVDIYRNGVLVASGVDTATWQDDDLVGGRYRYRVAEASGTATTMESSVEQFGLTVNFDQAYPVGQFANGDFFVVGSPTVTSVDPAWTGSLHGSMVNPAPIDGIGSNQGFRGGGCPRFSESHRASIPVALSPGDSFLHSRGWADDDPSAPTINPTYGVPRPAIRRVMCLTVLSEAPPAGSFRPPYIAGNAKMPNVSQLQWQLLSTLTNPASAPTLTETAARVNNGPWLDFVSHDLCRYIQPSEQMSSYGRDIGRDINEVILRLLCEGSQAEKTDTLIGAVQVGLDLWATVKHVENNGYSYGADGPSWWGGFGGAIGTGRKWPILFAGLMLDDADILADIAAFAPAYFGEDGQTYDVADFSGQTAEADWLRGSGGSWGERAWTRTTNSGNGLPGNTAYRTCCTATVWNGAALGARLMGAVDEWGHAPFFDYVDYYMDTETGADRAFTAYLGDMWDTYRGTV